MFYAILGIIVAVALFLIFRDDHDDSYNKSEKGPKKAQQPRSFSHTQGQPKQPKQPQQQPQPQPQYRKEAPKAAFKAEAKVEPPKASKKEPKPSLVDQVMGEIEAAIRDAKKGLDEPIGLFKTAIDETKAAFDRAMRGAGQNTRNAYVDEQPQPDEEDADLSFLDKLDYYQDLEENSETFDIVGLRYHCSVYDCGKVVGYVKPDPSNVHDARAQAVFRSDGKLLGYIPKTQQDWYEDFNRENVVCPFVGKIEQDNRGWLQAEIKVILPVNREFVREEMKDEL